MLSRVGRPREHDQRTAAALLAAGERAVTEGGLEALSVRGVAADAATTTRAVYSLFGSRDGLIVALGAHTYDLLAHSDRAACRRRPTPKPTWSKPGSCFAASRSSIPRCSRSGSNAPSPAQSYGHNSAPPPAMRSRCLSRRLARLQDERPARRRTVRDATIQFHSLCEGLAALELREALPAKDAERIWRDAFTALIAGFATTATAAATGSNHHRPATHEVRPDLAARQGDRASSEVGRGQWRSGGRRRLVPRERPPETAALAFSISGTITRRFSDSSQAAILPALLHPGDPAVWARSAPSAE